MVMGRRPGVARSSWPITTTDLMGLAGQLSTALARVPFRRPWSGEGNLPHNLAVAVTRETLRSFMGYSSSLPIAEWRSVELVLDDLCGVILPPLVRSVDIVQQPDTVAGVPGIWYRPKHGQARGTILYLHGGGYVGTSPRMYAVCSSPGCAVTPGARSSSPTSGWPPSSRSRPTWRTPCWSSRRCWSAASSRPGCSWPETRAAGDWSRR